MSAISPSTYLDPRTAGARGYVRAIVKRVYYQRRLWQVLRYGLVVLASLILALSLMGVADFVLHINRPMRIVFVLLTMLGALVPLVLAIRALTKRRTLADMARDVERAAGQKENALVTFAESLELADKSEAPTYMVDRLGVQARKNLESIDLNIVAPRRGAKHGLYLLGLVLLALIALRIVAPAAFARETRRVLWLEPDQKFSKNLRADGNGSSANNTTTIDDIHVQVIPPAYSGLRNEEAVGDAPIRALAGSQIEIELAVSGNVKDATLGFSGATSRLSSLGEGRYRGSFVAQTSGAFEVRVIADQENGLSPIVRAVEVFTDVQPEARITEPSSDQLLRAVPVSPTTVRWAARDDLGLSDVVLKYIRSRGEGDAAQFVNGVVPLTGIERASPQEWRGGAVLDLARLGMQPGDTLVYWIEARDRNPFANNVGRSASLAIAIMAPEPVKLNLGDLSPNEIGKFLLSERMIIVHTEKLHSERARIPKEDLMSRAQDIAAEQRDFKNSFNEYIRLEGAGEESENPNSVPPANVDEQVQEAEAERTGIHMHGIPEPPQGSASSVRDMVYAIRAMWDAEDALSLGDTAKALVAEREALTRLKRAQLAVRYVPPVVAISKPIDLKRRYAGELNEIRTRMERLSQPGESKEKASLRAALAQTYAALAELQATLDVPVTARAAAVARARERTRESANELSVVGGEHASTIAEALGQLRVVETELARADVSGSADVYSTRIGKSMALLTQAAANLFAIAEARTRSNGGEANTVLPIDDRRTSEYFLRLNR